jgi:copper(I)-binding protein
MTPTPVITSSRARPRAHRRITAALVAVLAAGPFITSCGDGDDDSSDPTTPAAAVVVTDVWARTSPAVATAGAVYLTIANSGGTDDALVAASVDPSVAARTEIHETVAASSEPMSTSGGMAGTGSTGAPMMEMRPVDRIVVPANGFVTLEPGGYHIMLLDLAAPLVVGSKVELTLTFERAGQQHVTADVRDNAP